jgi:hypothetical protein
MATTIYIVTTIVIFALNMFANLSMMAFNRSEKFPVSMFIGTMLAIVLVIWGVTLLVTS